MTSGRGIEPIRFAARGGAFPLRISDVGAVATITVSVSPRPTITPSSPEMIEAFLA